MNSSSILLETNFWTLGRLVMLSTTMPFRFSDFSNQRDISFAFRDDRFILVVVIYGREKRMRGE